MTYGGSAFVNGDDDRLIVTLVGRGVHLRFGIPSGIHPQITGADKLGVMGHHVAALADGSIIFHRAVMSADIPPDICLKISFGQDIVDMLSYQKGLGPTVRRVGLTIGFVNLCHPQFLARSLLLKQRIR
ncbi:hypothetical protein D3C75_723900 [compost metagenome]